MEGLPELYLRTDPFDKLEAVDGRPEFRCGSFASLMVDTRTGYDGSMKLAQTRHVANAIAAVEEHQA
jgi:hypothetical protein